MEIFFIKNNQELLLDLADFALKEQAEDNLIMVAIPQAWYNGSYTMATKPIKSLELHYTMIQFLIIVIIPLFSVTYAFMHLHALYHSSKASVIFFKNFFFTREQFLAFN